MKTLRLVAVVLFISLFAACGRQSTLNVNETGSVMRAANGGVYNAGCVAKANSPEAVTRCRVQEGDEDFDTQSRGLVGRGIATSPGVSPYYNPAASFDPFAWNYPQQNQYYNNQYQQNWMWNTDSFGWNQMQYFFTYDSQQVWGNQNGWSNWLYGYGGAYTQPQPTYGYGQGNSVCQYNWLQQPGFQTQSWDQNYLLCGSPWDPYNGYGYQPGYGGYYPQTGEKVVELTVDFVNNGQDATFYLSSQPLSGSAMQYQILRNGQVYRTIVKSKFDHIMNLINGIVTTTAQPVGNNVYCLAMPSETRTLKAKNGAINISVRTVPACNQQLENPDLKAKQLERYFLNLLNLSAY